MSDDLDTERDAAALDGMPPAWRLVYDRFREGHAAAVLAAMDAPGDAEAAAILHASSAAVRRFRQEYQRLSTRHIAGLIDDV